MSYTVLARKYRPQTFADMVGQEHVSRTLGNAIGSERVAHAFLFTGARGVGKTTTARLLAKALNCSEGPTPTPCNRCDACREIALGTDIDVLEIDGASNNSVDDVRRLQETLPFRPARDRYKVVIVDEVHMLSTGAFNAFLKTLEEPPAHVKFIFATTEIHKVPVTIRSRCQRYDFRLIPHAVISAHLRGILQQEQIEADEDAIALVAREAAGSMRDALTVLDQVLALGDKTLHGDAVAAALGIAGRQHVWSTVGAVLTGDAAHCLRSVTQVADQGLDVLHFTRALLECARDLVVLKIVGAEDELLELSPEERGDAKRLAEAHTREELERLFSGLSALVEEVGLAGMPKLALEMGLVRLADRPPLVPLRELLDRLGGLESRLGGGSPSAAGSGGSPGAAGRGGSPTAAGSGGSGAGAARGGWQGASGHGSAPSADQRAPVEPASPPPHASTASVRSGAPASAAAAPASEPPPSTGITTRLPPEAPAPRVAQPQPTAAAEPAVRLNGHRDNGAAEAAAPPPAPRAPEVAIPAGTAAAPAVDPGAARNPKAEASGQPTPLPPTGNPLLDGPWLQIVGQLKTSQPALAAVLDHGSPLEVTKTSLRIAFPEGSFFGRQAQSPAAREGILRAAELALGGRPELSIVRSSERSAPTLAAAEEENRRARAEGRREAALRHPRVQEALEVFGESEQSVDVHVEE